jgi:uncharacterized protein (DUF2141 family)
LISKNPMRRLAVILLAFPLISAIGPTAVIDVDVSGLRNQRGTVQVCLTRLPAHFPDCKGDPKALTGSVPANRGHVQFQTVPPGQYAVSVFHDENSNRKLDRFMGIPREGFGFSRNPVIRFGPPRFDKVSIQLAPGYTRAGVRMQYLL